MAINFPSSPTNGQVFADTSTGLAWVYSSTSTAWSASFNRSNYVSQTFTATAGQTSFTVSGGYLPTLVTVYQNGVLLVNGTDVTVTSGTAVVLAVGAVVGDIIQVIGSTTFNVAAIDASAVTTGTLVVARGGTGASTLTANNVLLGNGTSALQAVAPGTNGNVLTSNGTTWTSAALSIPAQGQIQRQLFTSSSSWTAPTGVTRVEVICVGGGGGAGVDGCTYGGGGWGGIAFGIYTVTPGTSYTVTIGAGGAGANAVNAVGSAGGTSSFGALVSATGGAGGGTSSNGANGNGSGGTFRNTNIANLPYHPFLGGYPDAQTDLQPAQTWTIGGNNAAGTRGIGFTNSQKGRGGFSGAILIQWVG